MQGWYAPSLTSMREAGVGGWETRHVVDLLKAGVSEKGSVMGPMAEVVFRSTQYLSQDDLRAMAVFLKALPQSSGSAAEAENRGLSPISEEVRAKGSKIYEQSCASCHGDDGEGAPGAYPALAGNRAVTMGIAANLVRVVLSGGYLPATAANPRPYGMPPFAHVLSDTDIAAVVSFIRGAWGNSAGPVSQLQVMKFRAGEAE
jgi:mono/diheme cytochrome c family protein